jgi:hypothetical protein
MIGRSRTVATARMIVAQYTITEHHSRMGEEANND